jgi:eukaryotic-like serine/threonine-protein kinase
MTGVEDRARTIFLAALERDPEQRPAFLDEDCGGDAEVRARVDQLLLAHDALGSIHVGGAPAATMELPPPAGHSGAVIGPYKLVEQIGEGGMGTVWMAQQTTPVKRLVAVKLIKAGMDSAQVIARFEAERQALALMEHPNIARVLDAGTTAAGRPYFVMDLVKGVPITRYCDEHHLTPRQRLELFIPVCQAVQHAHQKGIIHRDLKPNNVLVALYDGKPVPKVIDFGVAKASGQQLTEKTLVTGFGAIVGTLEYMSPEQAEVNQLDIDTRSDVYSLGVLLYELLAGSPPFGRKEFEGAGLLDTLRVIREQEPTRPSKKLSTAEGLPTLAANRGTEPAKLTRLVRGELDWIVMKALEKDRNRRYETANGFATDVQSYLADEPVLACPPSAIYRLKKFARRNKGPVLAASLVLLVLVGGAVGTTLGLIDARKGRVAAEQAEQAAEKSDAETRAVLDFVEQKILAAMRPEESGGLGRQATLRRAVEEALPFVENSFKNQPLTEARLRVTIGQSFLLMGLRETMKRAAEQFEAARALYGAHRGADHLDTINCMYNLAYVYDALGRKAEAAKLYEDTLLVQRAKLGSDHPRTHSTMDHLSAVYVALGRHAEAATLHEEMLPLQSARLGRDHRETLDSMRQLGIRYTLAGRHHDALRLRTELLALHKAKNGADDDDTLHAMLYLAGSYSALDQPAEALRLLEERQALVSGKYGPNSGRTSAAFELLARCKLLEEWVALVKANYAPDHPKTLAAMELLAGNYSITVPTLNPIPILEEIVSLRKAEGGADHPEILSHMQRLADFYSSRARHPEAAKLREELLGLHKTKFGPAAPATLQAMDDLADSYLRARARARAVQVMQDKVAIQTAGHRPDDLDTLASKHKLAGYFSLIGRDSDALRLEAETLAGRRERLGSDHPDTLISLWDVARYLIGLKRSAEALPLIDECLKHAARTDISPNMIPRVMGLRLGHFAAAKDVDGCRATAELWEKLNRTDADSLYQAAHMRAVTAAVLRGADSESALQENGAAAEADRAMAWLKQALAAGYKDVARLKRNSDFDALRDRDDFKKLMAELEAHEGKEKK